MHCVRERSLSLAAGAEPLCACPCAAGVAADAPLDGARRALVQALARRVVVARAREELPREVLLAFLEQLELAPGEGVELPTVHAPEAICLLSRVPVFEFLMECCRHG